MSLNRKRFGQGPRYYFGKRTWAALAGLTAVGIALTVRYGVGGRVASAVGFDGGNGAAETGAAAGQKRAPTAIVKPPLKNVAFVDGRPITREELGDECLRQHADEVLSAVINRFLIEQYCRDRKVTISDQEVDEEVQRTARRFGVPVDQFLTMMESKRGITPEHYANDIIWPTIALRKLAADQLKVTDEEVIKEFETRFGPQVRIRLISVGSQEKAEKIRAAVVANPDDFAKLANQYSSDVDSASAGGLIPPVRKHLGEPQLEAMAFGLQEGEISPVIPVHNQFLIIKCEGHIAAHPPAKAVMAAAELEIKAAVRDRKLRSTGTDLFRTLRSQAKIEIVMNDPTLSRQMPGVAARVNGQALTIAQLAEDCIARYGRQTLQELIGRRLLENALAERQLDVAPAEVEAEIARAALAADMVTQPGQPDVAKWIDTYTKQAKINETAYRHDVVWPSVALKKLVANKVQVTDEDMRRGFEASYGPRVRCRAIVLDNHRRALQVWDMARRNPTLSNFAKLAEEYSIEEGSKNLGGEVPPIQRNGGQPVLEKEAFALKPGEISGVIQLEDKFVILYCEGQTKPVVLHEAEVADVLREDIREKKCRLAMAREMERIQAETKIENLLDPSASHTPKKAKDKEARSGEVPSGQPSVLENVYPQAEGN
ncbi:MAG: peptidylprolyl isomerase [Planctomycetia bacterium]|nr:peptidylprolyl isomerase [Planctomycetia bacterium]